jgi:signal transduction histidine kinase
MGSVNNNHAYEMLPTALCVIQDGSIVYGNKRFRTLSGYAFNTHPILDATQVFHELPSLCRAPDHVRKLTTGLHTADGRSLHVHVAVAFGHWQEQEAHIVTVTKSSPDTAPTSPHNADDRLTALPERLMVTMAHEFRTPLSLIMTSVDMLDRYSDRLSPQRRTQRLQEIRVQVNRLTNMLDDINFIIREKSATHFRPVRVQLNELLQQIVERFRQQALPFQRVVEEIECNPCTARIDRDLLERALFNLLLNAMQYGSPLEDIRVRLHLDGGDVFIDVIDQGDGIAPEDQPYIFESFYRGKNNELEGSGLGLSIARHCIQLHNGSISLTSVPGETVFTIHLIAAVAEP